MIKKSYSCPEAENLDVQYEMNIMSIEGGNPKPFGAPEYPYDEEDKR